MEASVPQSPAVESQKLDWRKSRSGQDFALKVIVYILLLGWAAVFMTPLIWMITTSLKETGQEFPQDPVEQIKLATEAVFKSWNARRAIDYIQAGRQILERRDVEFAELFDL